MNEDTVERRPESVGQVEARTFDRCTRCHRRLKDPESMKVGLGPICRKRHAVELQKTQEA